MYNGDQEYCTWAVYDDFTSVPTHSVFQHCCVFRSHNCGMAINKLTETWEERGEVINRWRHWMQWKTEDSEGYTEGDRKNIRSPASVLVGRDRKVPVNSHIHYMSVVSLCVSTNRHACVCVRCGAGAAAAAGATAGSVISRKRERERLNG